MGRITKYKIRRISVPPIKSTKKLKEWNAAVEQARFLASSNIDGADDVMFQAIKDMRAYILGKKTITDAEREWVYVESAKYGEEIMRVIG